MDRESQNGRKDTRPEGEPGRAAEGSGATDDDRCCDGTHTIDEHVAYEYAVLADDDVAAARAKPVTLVHFSAESALRHARLEERVRAARTQVALMVPEIDRAVRVALAEAARPGREQDLVDWHEAARRLGTTVAALKKRRQRGQDIPGLVEVSERVIMFNPAKLRAKIERSAR